jgi:hypothetical protein
MGVPRMPAIQYEIYILISRPRYDDTLRVWLAYASISWDSDKFHYHQLNNLSKSFATEKEALAFGFIAARLWIEEHKSTTTKFES